MNDLTGHFSVLTFSAKVMKLVVPHCRWCVALKIGYESVCICFIQNCFNIQKLGLT